jgi:hypothetical protein
MTSKQTLKSHHERSAFARALSLLLLVFVVYGTTIEAVHRHGNPAGNRSATSSSVSDTETEKTLGLKLAGCNDCLLCQLHQNFSTSLISARCGINPPRLHVQYRETVRVGFQSQTFTPRTGRAPPQVT